MPENWSNVDLNSPSERDSALVDAFTFDTLLLEINCNIKEITPQAVRAQFEESLKLNIEQAREIFNDNLENIVKQAIKERNGK